MPFDLSTAIAIREREDGLLEKDAFDLSTAMPVDEVYSTREMRDGQETIINTIIPKSETTVISPKEPDGEGLEADWTLEKAAAWTLLTGGLYPVVAAVKGMADKTKTDEPLWQAAIEGIIEPETTKDVYENLPEKLTYEMPRWAKITAGISENVVLYGAAGLAKQVLLVRKIARDLNKAATAWIKDKFLPAGPQAEEALKNSFIKEAISRWTATETAGGVEGTLGTLKNVPPGSQFQTYVKRQNLFKLVIDELKNLGKSGQIGIPKVGQTVSFNSGGKMLSGVIKEIQGQRAIIDLEGRQVVAMLSTLTMPVKVESKPILKGKQGIVEPTAKGGGEGKYLYHNTSIRNLEGIKEQGLLSELAEDYPHGIESIPDEQKRIYFDESFERARNFGGKAKTGELAPLTLRVKKSILQDKGISPKTLKGEFWFFGNNIKPQDIEYYDNGEWRQLSPTEGKVGIDKTQFAKGHYIPTEGEVQKMVSETFQGIKQAKDAEFLLGPTASGKTSIAINLADEITIPIVDPDRYKVKYGGYTPENAPLYHEASSVANRTAIDKAVAEGLPFLNVVTGRNTEKFGKLVDKLKESGRPVKAHYIYVDLPESLRRNELRRATKKGMVIPNSAIKANHEGGVKTIFEVFIPKAEEVTIYENPYSSEGKAQALPVAEFINGKLTNLENKNTLANMLKEWYTFNGRRINDRQTTEIINALRKNEGNDPKATSRILNQTTPQEISTEVKSELPQSINQSQLPTTPTEGKVINADELKKMGNDIPKEYKNATFQLVTKPVSELTQTDFFEPAEWKQEYGKELLSDVKSGKKLPPIVIKEDGTILDGNKRFVAYQKAGIENVLVAKLSIPTISPELQPLAEEAKKYKSAEEFVKQGKYNIPQTNFDLTFSEELTAAYKGQKNLTITAVKDGKVVGRLEYSEFEKTPHINFIEILPEHKGQKIGSDLVIELQKSYPDKKIEWGMTTPEGTALKSSLNKNLTDFYNQVTGKVSQKIELPELPKETPPQTPIPPETPIVPPEPPPELPSEPSMPPEGDSVKRVIQALKEAKPIRAEQEALIKIERGKRIAKAKAIGEKIGGEAGYYARLGSLKGELPKVQFETLKGKISQSDIDSLFNRISKSDLNEWDKLPAMSGLAKLFGEFGGTVPTEGELKVLNKVFGKEFTDALLENRTLLQKFMEASGQLLNIPRSVMSSFDLSAPFRQGAFFIARPEFWPAYKEMFKFFGSEKALSILMQDIQSGSNYELMEEYNLALTDLDIDFSNREERFMSNWAERIPLAGIGIRASSRAYVGFLNKLRADVFNHLVEKAKQLGVETTDKFYTDLAEFINTATGRGKLTPKLEKAAVALNSAFFSPRLMASRIQLLNPVFYITKDPFVRKEALKSLFSFAGIWMTLLGLASLAGLTVGKDWRSSDFAKIKIGNIRIDLGAGFQQYLRMAGQLITGEYVSSVTGKVITLGEGYKPLTRFDIVLRQLENKESPVASFITALLRQKTFMGEDVNVLNEVGQRFTPMVLGDLIDLAKTNPKLLPLGILGLFGVGLQVYEDRTKSSSTRKSSTKGKRTSSTK